MASNMFSNPHWSAPHGQLVPQTAVEDASALDPTMTPKQTTLDLIDQHISRCTTKKYGESKRMVLPTAATLQGIRICLESIEAGGPVQYPEDVPASDKANYKNKCKTQFELSPDLPGIVLKKDSKEVGLGRYLVPREQIHAALVWVHRELGCKIGRDGTYNRLREIYSVYRQVSPSVYLWKIQIAHLISLPKTLVLEWLVGCPSCISGGKTTGLKRQERQERREREERQARQYAMPTLTRPARVTKTTGPKVGNAVPRSQLRTPSQSSAGSLPEDDVPAGFEPLPPGFEHIMAFNAQGIDQPLAPADTIAEYLPNVGWQPDHGTVSSLPSPPNETMHCNMEGAEDLHFEGKDLEDFNEFLERFDWGE